MSVFYFEYLTGHCYSICFVSESRPNRKDVLSSRSSIPNTPGASLLIGSDFSPRSEHRRSYSLYSIHNTNYSNYKRSVDHNNNNAATDADPYIQDVGVGVGGVGAVRRPQWDRGLFSSHAAKGLEQPTDGSDDQLKTKTNQS